MSIFDRILNRNDNSEPDPGPMLDPETVDVAVVSSKPRGFVAPSGKIDKAAFMRWLSSFNDNEYTFNELEIAARLPWVRSVIASIQREVSGYDLRVGPTATYSSMDDPEIVEKVARFSKLIRMPFPAGRYSFRLFSASLIENMLVFGRAPVEFLRDPRGQAALVASELKKSDGPLEYSDVVGRLVKAKQVPGPIVGLVPYSAKVIKERLNENGTYRDPAFLDLTEYIDSVRVTNPQCVPDQEGVPSWSFEDMLMLKYELGRDAPGEVGKSPTHDMYPLIDILFAVLYRIRDMIEGSIKDTIISIEPVSSSGAYAFLTPEALNDIVETIRADIAQGQVPIIAGFKATTSNIGGGQVFEQMSLLDQMIVLLNIGYGTSLNDIGRVVETGKGIEQIVQASRRQQVGNMLRILRDEVFYQVLQDQYSGYAGDISLTWRSDINALDVADRMEMLLEMVPQGLPIAAVLAQELPDMYVLLQQYGIDPWALLPPAVASAVAAQGGITVQEEEEGDVSENE